MMHIMLLACAWSACPCNIVLDDPQKRGDDLVDVGFLAPDPLDHYPIAANADVLLGPARSGRVRWDELDLGHRTHKEHWT